VNSIENRQKVNKRNEGQASAAAEEHVLMRTNDMKEKIEIVEVLTYVSMTDRIEVNK